eukprot:c4246_g1_i1.p1 GENE.c4246_g1_i1~~c4246_g1_i1.p1  ORF type:complete len:111 (-),score=15.88 c4246_g1_i1:89-421(-)
MGKIFKAYLSSDKIYSCLNCGTHFTQQDSLISKAFLGRYGRAFLFDKVVNVNFGPVEVCQLTTGMHTTREVYCVSCADYVGWKYEEAFEESQKYKEGKFILERAKITNEN